MIVLFALIIMNSFNQSAFAGLRIPNDLNGSDCFCLSSNWPIPCEGHPELIPICPGNRASDQPLGNSVLVLSCPRFQADVRQITNSSTTPGLSKVLFLDGRSQMVDSHGCTISSK